MKRKTITIFAVIIFLVCIVMSADTLLTNLIENINVVCRGQKFSSAEEALMAYEISEREANDTSLDYCPPFSLVYSFEYDENTIIFYSCCEEFDGEQREEYAVRALKKNRDGSLSFTGGFAEFELTEPNGNDRHRYFTNIETSHGKKSICILYLPKDSDKDIYVDGIKAEKQLALIENAEFYICYAISNPDTFFSNTSTDISDRHKIELREY